MNKKLKDELIGLVHDLRHNICIDKYEKAKIITDAINLALRVNEETKNES